MGERGIGWDHGPHNYIVVITTTSREDPRRTGGINRGQ